MRFYLLLLLVGFVLTNDIENPLTSKIIGGSDSKYNCFHKQNQSCSINDKYKEQEQLKNAKMDDDISLIAQQITSIEGTIQAYQKKLKLLKKLRDHYNKKSQTNLDTIVIDKLTLQTILRSQDKDQASPQNKDKQYPDKNKIQPAPPHSSQFSSRALLKQRKNIQNSPYLIYLSPIKYFQHTKNQQISMGLYLVYKQDTNASKIILTDLYFNELIKFTVNAQIKLISGSFHQEERYLTLVTNQDKVILYKINQINTKSPDYKKDLIFQKGLQNNLQKNEKFNQKSQASIQTKRNVSLYIYQLDQDISGRIFDYKQKFQSQPAEITAIEAFIQRGSKYVLLGDSKGRITIVNIPSMQIRNHFLTSVNYITSMKRTLNASSSTIFFSGEHSIGQAKFLQGTLQPSNCDAGSASSKIVGIEIDLSHTGILYSITESGDVYAFEIQRKNSFQSCSILSKISNSVQQKGSLQPQLQSLKGGLLMKLPNGSLMVLNTKNLDTISAGNQLYLVQKNVKLISGFLNSKTQYFTVLKIEQDEKKSVQLQAYEWNPINVKQNPSYLQNFGMTKLPIILGILLVVGYQFYKRKSSQNSYQNQKRTRNMNDLKQIQTLFNTQKNSRTSSSSRNFKNREEQLRNLERKVESLNHKASKKRVSFKDEEEQEGSDDQKYFKKANFVDEDNSDDY